MPSAHAHEEDCARLLADAFRRAGWAVSRAPRSAAADLVVRHDAIGYTILVKWMAEARRDRAVPLLAELILRARAAAGREPATEPLAVIGVERASPRLAHELHAFAEEFAPDVAVGVVDRNGHLAFSGRELEHLNASPDPRMRDVVSPAQSAPDMFSDLNQWMLKVLLAAALPESMLSAPRGEYRNASELARAANVSVMSSFRLVERLRKDGFLDSVHEPLRLVRAEELLRRWQAAAHRAPHEWTFRFALRQDRGGSLDQVLEFVRSASRATVSRGRSRQPARTTRMCLGLFSAAEMLGLGHVSGVTPHVFADDVRGLSPETMGLVRVPPGQTADLFLRVPLTRQSVFRGAVERNGVLVADALQVWLDVSSHPTRGKAQALEIERQILKPLLGGRR